jgi:hypothetical protein
VEIMRRRKTTLVGSRVTAAAVAVLFASCACAEAGLASRVAQDSDVCETLRKGPMHYRIAGIVVAKGSIGPPPELAAIIKPEPMLPRTGRVPGDVRR